jgi:hypothetical protein
MHFALVQPLSASMRLLQRKVMDSVGRLSTG